MGEENPIGFYRQGNRESMKKLGIIGGLGPMATAYFFELVVQMTDAKTDQEHLEIWVHNCPSIPDRSSYILDHTKENPLASILHSGRELCRMGAEWIAIPCVTAHYFYKELTESLSAPIIHIVEETAAVLKESGKKRIGILATDGTVASGLFQKELEKNEMEWVLPRKKEQQDIMDFIYRQIKTGQSVERVRFERVTDSLWEQGAEAIVLGCTELSLVKREYSLEKGYLDVMEVLAKRSVELCGAVLKREYQYLIK